MQRKDIEKVCAWCGKSYIGTKLQKYCCENCGQKARHVVEKQRKVIEKSEREYKAISLNAIAWAAKRASMTYGLLVQTLTKEDEERICKEYAAYLKERKEKEKEKEKEKRWSWI